MERIHLTQERVNGGIIVPCRTLKGIWSCCMSDRKGAYNNLASILQFIWSSQRIARYESFIPFNGLIE